MGMQKYWEMIARQKAHTDFQDDPEGFLKGSTNGYTKDVDSYMYDSYESERMLIINEMRRSTK